MGWEREPEVMRARTWRQGEVRGHGQSGDDRNRVETRWRRGVNNAPYGGHECVRHRIGPHAAPLRGTPHDATPTSSDILGRIEPSGQLERSGNAVSLGSRLAQRLGQQRAQRRDGGARNDRPDGDFECRDLCVDFRWRGVGLGRERVRRARRRNDNLQFQLRSEGHVSCGSEDFEARQSVAGQQRTRHRLVRQCLGVGCRLPQCHVHDRDQSADTRPDSRSLERYARRRAELPLHL